MAIHISSFVTLTLLAYVCSRRMEYHERPIMCPSPCFCYCFQGRIVTDCMEKNMTFMSLEKLDPDLFTLILDKNHLESIHPLPANMSVKILLLSHNNLTTIQKETFAGLKYLWIMDLSSNLINYVHPKAFIENADFNKLELQNNPLKPVEGPFLYSKSLQHLYLENCQLTTLSSSFFSKINGLIIVDLSGNPLLKIEVTVFSPLSQLVKLSLKNCGLTMLPANIFQNISGLIELDVSMNPLKPVEGPFLYSKSLQHLYLANCQLTTLSYSFFSKINGLITVDLSGNPLRTIEVPVFSPLSQLVKLSLRNCWLTKLPENTFRNISSLKELDVSMNPLNPLDKRFPRPLITGLTYIRVDSV